LVQALIAAEHAIAPHPDATDWPRIVERYDELVALDDTPVVRLNRAVAISEADGPLAGLRALDGLELPGPSSPAPSSSATTNPSAPTSPPGSRPWRDSPRRSGRVLGPPPDQNVGDY